MKKNYSFFLKLVSQNNMKIQKESKMRLNRKDREIKMVSLLLSYDQ